MGNQTEGLTLQIRELSAPKPRRYRLIRKADAILLVFSITDISSLNVIRDLAAWAMFDDIPCALVGTRADQEALRCVSWEDGKAFADKLGVQFLGEVSGMAGTYVENILDALAPLLNKCSDRL